MLVYSVQLRIVKELHDAAWNDKCQFEAREDDNKFRSPRWPHVYFWTVGGKTPQTFCHPAVQEIPLLSAGKTHNLFLSFPAVRGFAPFDIKELRELMETDEMELDTLGDRKTALFVIISDTDDTFNFVVSILYTQLFNLLCDKADDEYGGRLPSMYGVSTWCICEYRADTDLPLCKVLEGHYPGTFVSVTFNSDAIHCRSIIISGQCIGDPHRFLALLTVKINRLQLALHLRFTKMIWSLKRKGKVTFTDYCETLISRSSKRADYNTPRSGQLTENLSIQLCFLRRKKIFHIPLRV